MELIDKGGLKNCLSNLSEDYCYSCPRRTCTCIEFCRVPDFIKGDLVRYIDEQMVVESREDTDNAES